MTRKARLHIIIVYDNVAKQKKELFDHTPSLSAIIGYQCIQCLRLKGNIFLQMIRSLFGHSANSENWKITELAVKSPRFCILRGFLNAGDVIFSEHKSGMLRGRQYRRYFVR